MQVLELLQQQALAETDSAPACMSARGISIPAGATAQTQGVVRLRYSASRDPTHAAQHAAAAAARAATLNAQAGQGSSYGGNATASVSLTAQATACAAQVTFASIASLPQVSLRPREHQLDFVFLCAYLNFGVQVIV